MGWLLNKRRFVDEELEKNYNIYYKILAQNKNSEYSVFNSIAVIYDNLNNLSVIIEEHKEINDEVYQKLEMYMDSLKGIQNVVSRIISMNGNNKEFWKNIDIKLNGVILSKSLDKKIIGLKEVLEYILMSANNYHAKKLNQAA